MPGDRQLWRRVSAGELLMICLLGYAATLALALAIGMLADPHGSWPWAHPVIRLAAACWAGVWSGGLRRITGR